MQLVAFRDSFQEGRVADANKHLLRALQSRQLAHSFESAVQAEDLFARVLARWERLIHDVFSLSDLMPLIIYLLKYFLGLSLVRRLKQALLLSISPLCLLLLGKVPQAEAVLLQSIDLLALFLIDYWQAAERLFHISLSSFYRNLRLWQARLRTLRRGVVADRGPGLFDLIEGHSFVL